MPNRELFHVPLQPVAGSRFQPTGFPDIGAALFDRPVTNGDGTPGWEECLVLESAQSMGNHLEAAAWDTGAQAPAAAVAGLPYVRVVDERGEYVTSSRTEAHRLASAFVKDATLDGEDMKVVIKERLGLRDDTPLSPRDIAAAVFAMDPLCLVHGVFFADKAWPGQPRIARALTAFVEAHDVREAISGGVKKDDVRHSTSDAAGRATEGYGPVPFHRTEYVAREIEASFVLDLEQIGSYGLPEPATELLAAVARWEIRSLLDRGFRPRTACDLEIADPEAVASLPALDALTDEVRVLVGRCGDLLADGSPLEVVWDRSRHSKKPKGEAAA